MTTTNPAELDDPDLINRLKEEGQYETIEEIENLQARFRSHLAAEARAREEGAKAMQWPDQWPLGTRVRKRKGSSWQGHVVGYYSTHLTPCGYAVESEREPGSVQIYPKAALEALDPAQIAGGKP